MNLNFKHNVARIRLRRKNPIGGSRTLDRACCSTTLRLGQKNLKIAKTHKSLLTPENETPSKETDKINTITCPKMWHMKYVSNFKRKRGRYETRVVIKEGHLTIKASDDFLLIVVMPPSLEDGTIEFFKNGRNW